MALLLLDCLLSSYRNSKNNNLRASVKQKDFHEGWKECHGDSVAE